MTCELLRVRPEEDISQMFHFLGLAMKCHCVLTALVFLLKFHTNGIAPTCQSNVASDNSQQIWLVWNQLQPTKKWWMKGTTNNLCASSRWNFQTHKLSSAVNIWQAGMDVETTTVSSDSLFISNFSMKQFHEQNMVSDMNNRQFMQESLAVEWFILSIQQCSRVDIGVTSPTELLVATVAERKQCKVSCSSLTEWSRGKKPDCSVGLASIVSNWDTITSASDKSSKQRYF
mgnify:CR=1 FL=1